MRDNRCTIKCLETTEVFGNIESTKVVGKREHRCTMFQPEGGSARKQRLKEQPCSDKKLYPLKLIEQLSRKANIFNTLFYKLIRELNSKGCLRKYYEIS